MPDAGSQMPLSEDLSRVLWTESPLIILRIDHQERVIEANPYACELLGKNLQGKKIEAIFSSCLAWGPPPALSVIAQSPPPCRCSISSVTGHTVDLLLRVIRQADTSYSLVAWIDAPNLLQSEQKLLELSNDFGTYARNAFKDYQLRIDHLSKSHQQLFDVIENGLIGINSQGLITLANPHACSLFGMPEDQILGNPVSRHIQSIGPNDGNDGNIETLIRLVLTSGTSVRQIDAWALADKQSIPVRLSIYPLLHDRKAAEVIIVISDLSELAKKELIILSNNHLLQSVLDSIPLMISYWNRDLYNVFSNTEYAKYFGKTPEAIKGTLLSELLGDERFNHYAHRFEAVLTGEEQVFERSYDLAGGAGTRHALVRFIPDQVGERVAGFLILVTDVTSIKEAEFSLKLHSENLESLIESRTLELLVSKDRAEQANRTKDAFLANISHELRTPLNAVIGMASLALDHESPEKVQDYLKKIVSSGKHLNRLLNDLLDLSKIAAGRLELEEIPFSLRSLLSECRQMLQVKAEGKGIGLHLDIPSDIHDTLIGDPARIKQIVLNLAGNGIKFTQQGSVRITACVKEEHASKCQLNITVADTGIGITGEQIDRLFSPFTQGDASISRKFGGTGLGLALSQRIAEMMGGHIEVVSTQGSGSTFSVTVFLKTARDAGIRALENAPAHESMRFENARVLIVDDQPLNIEVAEGLLSRFGITCYSVPDGQQAVLAITNATDNFFDLVLMDIQMPVLDGLSATRQLRQRASFSQLPIIGMSAQSMDHEVKSALDSGMNAHLAKPVDEQALSKILSEWLSPGKRRLTHQQHVATSTESLNRIAQQVNLDITGIRSRFRDRTERYWHWVNDFAATAFESWIVIRESHEEGNVHEAVAKAHALKNRSGNLGFIDFHHSISDLEQLILQQKATHEDFNRTESCLMTLISGLRSVIQQDKDPILRQRITLADWKARFSVGVEELDLQHLAFVSAIQDLERLIQSGSTSKTELHCALSRLHDYAEQHFSAEERYLIQIGYGQINDHQEEHRSFMRKLLEFNELAVSNDQSKSCFAVEVLQYLSFWLENHIETFDQKYKHFKKHGQ